MNSRLEKVQQLSEKLRSKYNEIREIQERVYKLEEEVYEIEQEKIKNTILGNIEDGNLLTPEPFKDDESKDKDFDDEEAEEMEYEEPEDDLDIIDVLKTLEAMHFRYGEEYVLPMGEYGFTPDDDYDGWDTVKSGIVIKVDGKYIVNGQHQFESVDELIYWASTAAYKDFVSDKKNQIKLGALKNVSIQQLEDMFDGKEISKEKLSKRERFEQALLRDDVVDFFLEKSPEEIEAFFGKDVARMVAFDQNNPHHCYDLFEHTLNVVEGIETDGLSQEEIIKLKVAAFLHDVGKPDVAMNKGDKTVFYNHPKKSAQLSENILGALNYKPDEIEQIQFYIEHHDDFINFKRENEDWNRKNRFLRGINLQNVAKKIQETKEDISIYSGYNPTMKDYQLLLRLCKADANAQSRIVREYGKVTDSRANKIDRLSQVEDLVPQAYDLSLEMTADRIKDSSKINEKFIGDALDRKVRNETNIFGGDGRVKIVIDDDIIEYYQKIREAFVQEGKSMYIPENVQKEMQSKGMTDEQYKKILDLLRKDSANRIIGGIAEIHKEGKLTQLFDVKKALIERNRDAEKLLQQYEERLKREGIQQDK